MDVIVHPRAGRGPVLQVWVGVFGVSNAVSLRWLLDGSDATPVALRELSGARPAPGMVDPGVPRAFTGVYEFQRGITPDTTYTVRVGAAGGAGVTWSDPVPVRTLPAEVPPGGTETFNILLVSCFYQGEDRAGFAGTLVKQLPPVHRPHLTLLVGDQVYLDLPTLRNFHGDTKWLAGKFESDYTTNWRGPGGYSEILHAAPTASIPDDHEYWNNAPHASPVVWQSTIADSREHWRSAARTMYDAFQLSVPGQYQPMLALDVPPLSFFLMDNRTFRDRDRRTTLPPGGLTQFQQWAADVARAGLFGVVVTGQSLLQREAGALQGAVGDRSMANYGDYAAIMNTIIELARAGRPVLCLAGDVHYGRVVAAEEVGRPGTKVYEIISSPASLVSTVGIDQLQRLLKGRRDPWYRFRTAEAPPTVITHDGMTARLSTSMLYPLDGQKGNHVTQLSFRRSGFGLELGITYWMIAQSGAPARTFALDPILLSPTL